MISMIQFKSSPRGPLQTGEVESMGWPSPVLMLQQQLVEFLGLGTAVQVVRLLQNLLCTAGKKQQQQIQKTAFFYW